MKLSLRFLLLASLVWSGLGAQSVNVEKEIKKLETRGLPYCYNAEIEQYTQDWLLNENGGTSIVLGRYKYYSQQIDVVRKKMDLPWFVTIFPAANTGFEPRFKDESGTAGMWPLSYLMAKKYGLKQLALYDERRDPQASTLAACKYLKDLYQIYGDWLKVITAFRIGPARLNQVIHEAGTLDFKEIYEFLEPEERIPVIQFYAAAVALSYSQETGMIGEVAYSQVETDTVSSVNVIVPVKLIQDHFNVNLNEFRNLNPSLKADYIPYLGKPFVFKLSKKDAKRFRMKKDSVMYWISERTIEPMKYDTLLEVLENNDTLTIIKSKDELEEEENTVIPKLHSQRKVWVTYKIKKGDALFTLTDIFDCTAEQLRSWNKVRGNYLAVGKTLKFYVLAEKKSFYLSLNRLSLPEKRKVAEQD